jgi:hypothetical protein
MATILERKPFIKLKMNSSMHLILSSGIPNIDPKVSETLLDISSRMFCTWMEEKKAV